eukprot:NODE_5642_length_561_cov_78.052734_g4907_i0.p2 GENE.NODE_5642_length_561_cov_78.052734_g4907_i0~~NODE_5642_length_561_cov_78.052734_g4907_i0.p2  ORF type:complete len:81 (+),score=9.20 NODE_5642_length_561_cov_78.052734_g4907_i0:258-500(+)
MLLFGDIFAFCHPLCMGEPVGHFFRTYLLLLSLLLSEHPFSWALSKNGYWFHLHIVMCYTISQHSMQCGCVGHALQLFAM